jgi:hypothetical protein
MHYTLNYSYTSLSDANDWLCGPARAVNNIEVKGYIPMRSPAEGSLDS